MTEHSSQKGINIYAFIFKYFFYWPWFVCCILLSLVSTFIYLKYQTPMYSIQSAVLIKEQDQTQKGNNQALSAIQDLGMMTMTNNFDNELQILKSHTLVRKVVTDLGLYITHTEDRSWGYDIPLYRNEPVKIYMSPDEAELLESNITIRMNYSSPKQIEAEVLYIHQPLREAHLVREGWRLLRRYPPERYGTQVAPFLCRGWREERRSP